MFHFIFDYNYGNFLIDFNNFSTVGNRNEYSTKMTQTVSLQPNYVSALPGKIKNNTKNSRTLVQCVLLNRMFQTFTESDSRSMFLSSAVTKFL